MDVHPAPAYYAKEMKCFIGRVLMLVNNIYMPENLGKHKQRAETLNKGSGHVMFG